jgi:HlyD family secretion protein
MRRIAILLAVLGLLGGAAYLWGSPAMAQWRLPFLGSGEAAAPRLRLAPVDRGPITAVVSATGTVNPTVSVIVGSQLSGQIRDLPGDFNQRVLAGQVLARLDTQQLEATRAAAVADSQSAQAAVLVARAQAERAEADAAQAEAQLAAARSAVAQVEAQLRDAEFEARRTEDLRRTGVGAVRDAARAGFTAEGQRANLAQSQAQARQAEANLTSARAIARTALAQIAAAEATAEQKAAQLRQVEVNLSFATIRSPIDGVVLSRSVDLGQTVAASLQSPILFTIAANLDEMEVWATVDEADIGRIRAGQPVQFTVAAHPSANLRGQVKEVRLAPLTVNNVVTYTVVVTARNEGGRMLPGMTATLRIVADERAEALRVPNAALRWRPPGRGEGGAAAPPQSPMEQAIADMEDLTPGQRAEIEAAQREFRERLAGLPAEGEARRQQAQAARQRLASRIGAVLTPDQRARLAAARGGRSAEGQAATVWVMEGGEPRPRRIRTGLTDGNVTEVLGDVLQPGMEVIVGQERGGAAPRPAPAGRPLF